MPEYGGRNGAAELAEIIRPDVVIRRTADGWAVDAPCPRQHSEAIDDLCTAMVLADLLADEGRRPGPRPQRPPASVSDVDHLRTAVRQLEHALSARVLIEQAIGVLTERWHTTPRNAFEQLRRVARSKGRRVHDLAGEVVASCTDPNIRLPDDLGPPPDLEPDEEPSRTA